MKRQLFGRAWAALAASALMVPALAACGGDTAATPTATTITGTGEPTATTMTAEATATTAMEATTPTTGSSTGKTLKVGLVTDVGSLNDKSFNESTWEGVLRAQKELGVEAKNIETKDTKDYAKNIDQFVSQNYDVIVTVGFALQEATNAAAKANPNIKFIGVDQFQTDVLPNVSGLIFDEDKAGYLAGALAASLSKSNNIGAVCGTDDVPPVWKFGEAYKAGAKSIKPDITVQVTYHSDVDISKSFVDPDWGKTTALSMIDKGADVVFGAGGLTGNGAIFAAKERNIAAIGVDKDQYLSIGEEYKGALASSAMKLLTPGTFDLIKQVQDGSFKGGNFVGEVALAPFHDWESKVPADVKTKLQEIDKGLKDGSIKTCVSPAKGVPSPCGGAAETTPGAAMTPAAGETPSGVMTPVGTAVP
ncbi:MAG TPA: BMP family ABC transporter substrate-binding protein [Chloroflexia bacterium]|nr:BMP family ABC transporter substrate-binding protein [Chloroflexia bacterium]